MLHERRKTGTPQEVINRAKQKAYRERKGKGNSEEYWYRYDRLTAQAYFGGIDTLTEKVITSYGAHIRDRLSIADVRETVYEGRWLVPGKTEVEIQNVKVALQTVVTFKRQPLKSLEKGLDRGGRSLGRGLGRGLRNLGRGIGRSLQSIASSQIEHE